MWSIATFEYGTRSVSLRKTARWGTGNAECDQSAGEDSLTVVLWWDFLFIHLFDLKRALLPDEEVFS